ncbi:alkene reductase [Arthrobacter sp. NPDC089319]|uniref:alkene reductase n=1 Tax=Arthrobacter sp. NPDC089319 TaxID=3155915 RepID=UPI00343BF91F
MHKALTPAQFGRLKLRNRFVMAPLTRLRSTPDGTPGALLAEYYRQRASSGLIITEGTWPSPESKALDGQPGIVTEQQITGWKQITKAVHDAGGQMVLQIMHAGRVSHTRITQTPRIVAPSAIAMPGDVHTATGKLPYPVPHALTTAEITNVINEFVAAAQNAMRADFDGVEIHAANGYLLHQFLAPNTNRRDDEYGSNPENKARLAIQVTRAVAECIGADRVGVRLSPGNNIHGIEEEDTEDLRQTYQTIAKGLAPLGLAYVSVVHPVPACDFIQGLRRTIAAPLIANTGPNTQTTRHDAYRILTEDSADAVAIGRSMIANPDLVERWTRGYPENEPDAATFYGSSSRGYTDYPALR